MATWPEIELGRLADIVGGGTPKREHGEYWAGEIPWVTPTDLPPIGASIVEISETKDSITADGLSASSARMVPKGTVLLSSRATIGKIAIAAAALCTNQGFANLVPKPFVDSRYLAYALQNHVADITALAGSTTFKEVPKSALKKVRIPLPPLSEQRRIVELLDQADHLRRLRTEANTKADRILSTLFIQMFGQPSGWDARSDTRPVGDLIHPLVGGATPSKTDPAYWNGEIPWVSPKSMKRDLIVDTEDRITELALDEAPLRLIPSGAVLIVVRGMILAHSVPVAIAGRELVVNQDMKALVPKRPITGEFLFSALRTAEAALWTHVRTAAHGTRKLNTEDLVAFRVPVPDDCQLASFTSAYARIMCASSKCTESAAGIRALNQALVHRAFAGDLTARWREARLPKLRREMERQAKVLAEAAP